MKDIRHNKMKQQQIPVSDLLKIIGHPIDVFFCCGSFEERSLTIANAIGPNNVKYPIVTRNTNLTQFVEKNKNKLIELFGSNAIVADMDSSDPLKTGDAIKKAISEVISKKPLTYLIDLSTFTHESLLILIKLLSLNLKPRDKIFCAYVGAAEYSLGDKDEDKWLTKGIADVRSVLGYPGEIHPLKPTHVIVLVGFEHERAAGLINALEPDIISLGYGRPGTESDKKHLPANKHFHTLLKTITSSYSTVHDFEFSCTNPLDTRDALRACIEEYPDHNVIIAPMNTKVSTIGAALMAFENDEIQLCYSQPSQYNYIYYSTPGKNCYLFNLSNILPNKELII